MTSAVSMRSMLGLPASTASTSDSTLVIIDAQNEYANGKLAVSGVEASRAKIAFLLEKYRAAKAPVIHVVHEVPADAPLFTPGTDLAEEFSELKPVEGESVVTKHFPGSFTGTNLENLLKATGRNKVVLTGYMAHVCISTTARQASEKGWDVIVVEDAVGDRNIPGTSAEELTRVSLAEIADAFGTVLKSIDIK
ncbi:putative isochorismatase family protein YddQ [Colletotrichum siamense]|uniref:Isochorismatase family protein YddQ n=1 Tax=Colletotrichum siamense TaxID=690259 RepID=A0A9P5EP80_COLSI|nr:putative isochorismatase family protein YddQ [Colletotrichum siamense]KAF4855736.1 putative isochorismatase family protein YddQ [Colletotrichum siamense]